MRSTGVVLAAGAIAAANETIFSPVKSSNPLSNFNWRLVPATGVLAITLAGLEKAAPDFAVGLAALVLLAVLIVPVGNAPTPVDNIIRTLGLQNPGLTLAQTGISAVQNKTG